MDKREINSKLDVFISSKIDSRYTPIRKALGALLYESGLVGYVYVFEEEGATSDSVKSAYLKEVAQSDLCIFLMIIKMVIVITYMQSTKLPKLKEYTVCISFAVKERKKQRHFKLN